MSEGQPAVKPTVGTFSNGQDSKVADVFLRESLLPLSLREAFPVVVLRTEDKFDRTMQNNETGETMKLPNESYVHIAGGIKLIIPGGSAKRRNELPPEGEFVLVQIRTQVNQKFGTVKYFLEKWRPIKDILSLRDATPVGFPLRFPGQLVSGTEGFDFDVVKAEGIV